MEFGDSDDEKVEIINELKDSIGNKIAESIMETYDEPVKEELKEEPKEERSDKVKISKKVLRTHIITQLEELSEKSGLPLPQHYKRMKKRDLQNLLGDMLQSTVEKVNTFGIDLPPTEEDTPEIEEDENTNFPSKEDIIINFLYKAGLISMDAIEGVSKISSVRKYTKNMVLNDWSKTFSSNKLMEDQLKDCIKEIYKENVDWIGDYLSPMNRLYFLIGMSAMGSIQEYKEPVVESNQTVVEI